MFCLFLSSALPVALADDQEIDSLRGLPPLVVAVKVMAPIPIGIGESDLKAAIESRLKNAGIRIATGFDTLLAPQLFVSVTAPTGKFGLFGINASLFQSVKPWRPDACTGPVSDVTCAANKAPTIVLTTWHADTTSMVADGNPITPTREIVEKIIDGFAKDFRTANPK